MVDTVDSKSTGSNTVRVQVSPGPPIKSSSDIDIELINSNLELTPDQRLFQHQAALDLLWELDRAREKLNAKSQQSA